MEQTERLIVLLRHGIAEPRGTRENDDERVLTPTGQRRMKEIGKGLAKLFPKVEAIYSSPLIRCVQTAERVVNGYGGRLLLQESAALRPDAGFDDLRAMIASSDAQRIVCVGHEPSLSKAMRALTKMRGGTIELKKGGCYGVRILADGKATLEWMLPPRVLRRLAGG